MWIESSASKENQPFTLPINCYKLVVDPVLKPGEMKRVIRFDGIHADEAYHCNADPHDPRDQRYRERLKYNVESKTFKPLNYSDGAISNGSHEQFSDRNGYIQNHATHFNNQQPYNRDNYFRRPHVLQNVNGRRSQQLYQQQLEREKAEVLKQKQDEKQVHEIMGKLMPMLKNSLQEILQRDIQRKFIESNAYKQFENWWSDNEKHEKEKQSSISLSLENSACWDPTTFLSLIIKPAGESDTDKLSLSISSSGSLQEISTESETEIESSESSTTFDSPSTENVYEDETPFGEQSTSVSEVSDKVDQDDGSNMEDLSNENVSIVVLDHCYCEPREYSPMIHSGHTGSPTFMKPQNVNVVSNHIPKIYPKRSEAEELVVCKNFENGIDDEDIYYMEKAFANLKRQKPEHPWFKQTRWVDHPPTIDDSDEDQPHKTGSARTEGWCRLDHSKKKQQKLDFNFTASPKAVDKKQNNGRFDAQDPATNLSVVPKNGEGGRGRKRPALRNRETLLKKRLSVNTIDSNNEDMPTEPTIKHNQLLSRGKKLHFGKSNIHDWGLFAAEPISAGEMVIEYVGEKIRSIISDIRERQYESLNIGSSYFFRLDSETVIDATRSGNAGRFINHSCNPNCQPKIISIDGRKHIVIYSKQPIKVDEEITYDYKFPIEDEKIPCHCKSLNCRGTLN